MLVYILYSPSTDIFYTGFTTESIESRLQRHLSKYYENKFTSKIDDWEVFLTISCISNQQARALEVHIKRMKSKKYIRNLKAFPEIIEKLLIKFTDS